MTKFFATAHGLVVLEPDGAGRVLDTPARDLTQFLRLGGELRHVAKIPTAGRLDPPFGPLRPPVSAPIAFWAQGGGYRGHLAGDERPAHPRFFLISPHSITGPETPIVLPGPAPSEVDYEGELALVIGERMSNVPEREVWRHVAGLTLLNDITARDVQRGRQPGAEGIDNFAIAKSFDTFSPLGPAVVTPDEFADLQRIPLRTYVNGELRQDATTEDLIFSVPELLAFLSARVTLHPGDLVSTGSPTGIGEPQGFFLRPGMEVRIESSVIGTLRNVVV